MVAKGERRERLRRDGIVINGKRYDLNVKTPEEARGVALLLVSTKYGALRDLVLFVERANELWYAARLSTWRYGAVGKPSLNRAKVACCRPETG